MTKARLSNFDPDTIQTASSVAFLSSYRSDLSATITFTQTSSTNVTLSSQLTTTGITLSGSATGIIIPSGTPSPTTNALYNNSGTLYFNGSSIGGASLSSPLTGFTLGTDGTQLTATDTILQAFQKIQVQDNTLSTNIASLQPATLASAIGSWTAYTPTWTASTTNPTIGNGWITGFYRRVGDSVEIKILAQLGSTSSIGSGTYNFSLPAGLNIDASKLTNSANDNLGFVQAYNGIGTAIGSGYVTCNTGVSTTTVYGLGEGGFGTVFPFVPAAGCFYALHFTVPITTYSANINLLTNFTEYLSCTGAAGVAANTTYTPTTVYGSAGSLFPLVTISSTSATTVTTYKLTTAQNIQPTDFIELDINFNGYWIPLSSWPGNSITNTSVNGVITGMSCAVTGAKEISVYFSNAGLVPGATYGIATGNWSSLSTWYWRVRKISNGNFAQGSPSYSQTIGDGASTSIVVTHNLGTLDVQANVWELTGNLRQITSGIEIRNTSTTQTTLVFASAPALNSLRVTIFSSGGTQAMGDRLSPIANAERLITTTDTASVNTWNNCTATSANYTVTLPTAASAAGKILGIRIDPSSTYLVTIAGNGAELIDGQNTRIMWAKEVAELKSDGTSWTKIAGKSIPMTSQLGCNANQTFVYNAWNTLSSFFGVSIINNAPAAFVTAASGRFTAIRPGQYQIGLFAMTNTTNASAAVVYLGPSKNGASSPVFGTQTYDPASSSTGLSLIYNMTLALNDYIQAMCFYNNGSYVTSVLYNDSANHTVNIFQITEIPTW